MSIINLLNALPGAVAYLRTRRGSKFNKPNVRQKKRKILLFQ